MKVKNQKIWAARTALAKLANTDLPLPALLAVAPLLDACAPVLDELREMDGIVEDDEARESFARVMCDLTEIPSADLPCLPEIRMNYLELSAIREIINVKG
jgi:hypothetical protein